MCSAAIDCPSPVGHARRARLVPVAIIVYVISFMDRTNIGFALSDLQSDLHINAAQQGLAAGILGGSHEGDRRPGQGQLAVKW